MNRPRNTRLDSGAPTAALALHRGMRDQSLKVRWHELASACDRMAQWRSFSLWVRAIVTAEQRLPQWLAAEIEERCPAFLRSRRKDADLASLWLDLNEWVDFHFFGEAIQGDWIQALHYYYGRQFVAERIWQQWTRMDGEWHSRRPAEYPAFDHWQQEILEASTITRVASDYVEWEAFAFWTRSLVEAVHEIPAIVRNTVEERCPGFVGYIMAIRERPCTDPAWLWEQLRNWIEAHVFAETSRDSSIEHLRAEAHRMLRSERIVDYWANCQDREAPSPLPTFEQWLEEADAFVLR